MKNACIALRLAVVPQEQQRLRTQSEGVDTRKAAMTSVAGGGPSPWPAAIQLKWRAPATVKLPRDTASTGGLTDRWLARPEHCTD